MSARRARPYTMAFTLEDPLSPGSRKGGLTWSAGQVVISKDGAAAVNTTNLPTAISGAPAGAYSLVLTAAEMDANEVLVMVTHPSAGAYDEKHKTAAGAGPYSASVVANGGNTATTFDTDRTESTADHWKDALLCFTTGALEGQVKKVSAYDGTTKFVTLSSAFTGAPAAGDRFLLIDT